MAKPFLTAAWRNLVMANYAIDPDLLKPYLPCHTELDAFEGVYYISLVGFLFDDTRVLGLSIPFHRRFEEVNLRFYVRYKVNGSWKRGVVFLKEIVPRRMISFVANTVYGENYATHAMKHNWQYKNDQLLVDYYWKVARDWNYIKVVADAASAPVRPHSAEEFITEHYWGYTSISKYSSGEYEVKHPKWQVHPVTSYHVHCNAGALYGPSFIEPLAQKPLSVFLAAGSAIEVHKGRRLVH